MSTTERKSKFDDMTGSEMKVKVGSVLAVLGALAMFVGLAWMSGSHILALSTPAMIFIGGIVSLVVGGLLSGRLKSKKGDLGA